MEQLSPWRHYNRSNDLVVAPFNLPNQSLVSLGSHLIGFPISNMSLDLLLLLVDQTMDENPQHATQKRHWR